MIMGYDVTLYYSIEIEWCPRPSLTLRLKCQSIDSSECGTRALIGTKTFISTFIPNNVESEGLRGLPHAASEQTQIVDIMSVYIYSI